MDIIDLHRYTRLLLAKRQELSAARTDATAPLPGAGVPQGDLLDQATADTEAELQILLRRSSGRLLRAIQGALTRIKHRKFGVCEACRCPISKARLNAVPWTRLCRNCKEQQQGRL